MSLQEKENDLPVFFLIADVLNVRLGSSARLDKTSDRNIDTCVIMHERFVEQKHMYESSESNTCTNLVRVKNREETGMPIGTASANSVESNLGCTSRIYFDNVALT